MEPKFDIKTLRTIHTLCTSGSVTHAAQILGVSPGTISYIINKARKATGSALFFRTQHGMKPDSLAKELSQTYQKIVHSLDIEDVLASTDKQRFTVSCYTLIELLISVQLMQQRPALPRINFSAAMENDSDRVIKLRNREVDIDIGSRLPVDSSVLQLKFFTSGISAIVRQDHPAIQQTFTLTDWADHQHAIWSRGMHLISDDIEQTSRFNALFAARDVAVVASSTLNLVLLCAHSDLIILLPGLVAKKLQELLPIAVLDVPPELDMQYECYLHYHHALADNPLFKDVVQAFQHIIADH